MNKTLEQEKTTVLKPFPFKKDEIYLLKLKTGVDIYTVAVWDNGQFYSEFNNQYIEEEIENYVAIKDLGL